MAEPLQPPLHRQFGSNAERELFNVAFCVFAGLFFLIMFLAHVIGETFRWRRYAPPPGAPREKYDYDAA